MGRINILLQSGIVKEAIVVPSEEISLRWLRELATKFIEKIYPQHGLDDALPDHLLLYRHDVSSANILQLITSSDDVCDGILIEVVVSPCPNQERLVVHPHMLYVHSYKSPTFCDFCGELLFGLMKQGLKCEGCGLNYHKRCASKIPNNCSGSRHRHPSAVSLSARNSITKAGLSLRTSTETGIGITKQRSKSATVSPTMGNFSKTVPPDILITTTDDIGLDIQPVSPVERNNFLQMSRKDRSGSWSGRPLWMELAEATRIKVPHTFQVHSYKLPTVCQYCKKLLKGLIRQGLQCRDCKYNCHKKCAEMVAKDCPGSDITNSMQYMHSGSQDEEVGVEIDVGSMENLRIHSASSESEESDVANGEMPEETRDQQDGCSRTARIKKAQTTPSAPLQATGTVDDTNQSVSQTDEILSESQNIPLMRVVMSKKQTKPYNAKVLKEGWLMHYTNRRCMRKKHYWRLDSKSIVLYHDDSTTRFYKEIPLCEILEVKHVSYQPGLECPTHFFEIRTRKSTFFITGDPTIGAGLGNADIAAGWAAAIKQALMPVTPQTSAISTAMVPPGTDNQQQQHQQQQLHHQNMQQLNVPTQGETGQLGVELRSEHDFSQLYQIFADEILGSGQFGTVYGGIYRKTGRHVAVKLIDKMKFPSNKEAALRTEVDIMRKVRHPGVVAFQEMLETPDRIFVVMEKLRGDMLEMILSSEKGRLSERITQFLVHQILIALRYLHSLNIVHCDLKPENILLASDSDFPQVKLCDFGFARIIGERGFRRSVVGTPAYLAPEVLRNKGFNRSLDMWSVGVIVYVSLSGTFPFNEDEDINDQIQNADFMYPANPWREVTSTAIDFINGLLQVKMSKRLTVLKALSHNWLQNYQLWSDLRCLEKEVGERFLTHESDDARWSDYEHELGLKPIYL